MTAILFAAGTTMGIIVDVGGLQSNLRKWERERISAASLLRATKATVTTLNEHVPCVCHRTGAIAA